MGSEIFRYFSMNAARRALLSLDFPALSEML
jgi:hypothetical protein